MSFDFDQELDCSGLACPMPILKTKKAVDGLQTGQVLKMTATDPGQFPTSRPGPRRQATRCLAMKNKVKNSSSTSGGNKLEPTETGRL